MNPLEVVEVPLHVDSRGNLGVVSFDFVPFSLKRSFWIYNVPKDQYRGRHGHLVTNQFLISIQGTVGINFATSNLDSKSVELRTGQGIWIPPRVWIEMRFSSLTDTLLVFADSNYDPEDFFSSIEELG